MEVNSLTFVAIAISILVPSNILLINYVKTISQNNSFE